MRLWVISIIFLILCFFFKIFNNRLDYFFNQRNAFFKIYEFKHFGILIQLFLKTTHPPTLPHSHPSTEVSLKMGIISYLPFITLLLPLSLKASLRTEILIINKPDRCMNYKSLCIPAGKIHREAHSWFTLDTPASANVHQGLILNNAMFLFI